jgi:hypothetical protein
VCEYIIDASKVLNILFARLWNVLSRVNIAEGLIPERSFFPQKEWTRFKVNRPLNVVRIKRTQRLVLFKRIGSIQFQLTTRGKLTIQILLNI